MIHVDSVQANFPGAKAKYTESLDFLNPDEADGIPIYRVMNNEGQIIKSDHDPNLGKSYLLNLQTEYGMYSRHSRYICK